jgi:Tfp pilus assembly protein PilN
MKAVNLLPPDLRSASKRTVKRSGAPAPEAPGGSGPFIILGALALCVLGLAGYVLAGNSVKEREAELARVTVEHQAAQQKVAALKPYGDFEQMALRRISTVKELAAMRFDWEQALRDISHATPSSVMLTALNGSVAAGEGGGSNAMRAAIPSPAIELEGCTLSQPHVARLMARLRTIRGVSRVSLSNSTLADGDTSATSPCGDGPNFQVVAFFERSTAAAGAEPTLTSAPATTAPPVATPAPAAPTAETTTGATTAP